MLYYGNLKSDKTEILIQNYAKLLNEGISADEILVIVQNSKLKEEFIEKTKKLLKIEAVTKFHCYSFFGLCYNYISEYYPIIENKILKGKSVVFPHLCGLEASRQIFKNSIDKIKFKGYNSKTNLLHQLLRRLSLITLNGLSESEIKEKTKILAESFTYEVSNAINLYKDKTLELRAFDYLRQVQLFSYIYKNIKNSYKYVFVDDADEITPSLFEFLKYIKNDIKEFFIAYDPLGTTRKGYLCAEENNFELFLNESPRKLNEDSEADLIFEKIKNNEPVLIKKLSQKDFIRADEMAENVVKRVNSLLNSGLKPKDILIVIPDDDSFLKLYLEKINAPVSFITGSEKIEEEKTVFHLITGLKLLIENENYKISPYRLKGFLGEILKCSLNDTVQISQDFEAGFLDNNIFEILEKHSEIEGVRKFLEIKNGGKSKKLSELLFLISKNFVEKKAENKKVIQKINLLLKQIRDYEEIFKNDVINKDLLFQLENTIIAENPIENNRLDDVSIKVSTPQKAIDFKLKNKFMFLLDTTNSNWTKQDIGPLYNSWVFQKKWIKKTFTLEDNIFCSCDKIARTVRKLYLLAEGEIEGYSSTYNFLGVENFKGIKHFFCTQNEEINEGFKIVPREDQKPVLEYKNGRYAVMAVAGAGKTTIMLALIMKLLKEGVKAQNIFVLTYMDSAARTFKERIKSCYPDAELPNISTIHGLAMRILKENNNHALLNIDVDFEIIDDIKKIKLISEIICNEGLEANKSSSFERAISAFKNSSYKNENNLPPSFKRVFLEYQRSIKSLNMIDYDDLLILALDLLKGNLKVREYYQNLAHFVIEDEAQDSSSIQQELINIISRKHGNIIRCGDVNQAITGTFTNSDTSGFKKFIQNNENTKMNYSARNSTGVINAANILIKKGLEISPDSFLEIETKPISGKNIVDPLGCNLKIFDREEEEKNFIKDKIKEIFALNKTPNVGILTRTNREAENLAEYLRGTLSYKVTTQTGLLADNQIFIAILNVFNFLSCPMNNKVIFDFAQNMMKLGFYMKDVEIFNRLKEKSPFILNNNEEFAIWWDLRYFLELTVLPPYEAAYKIGEYYFSNNKKKKLNIAPITSLVQKIFTLEGNFEDTLNRMNEINMRNYSNIKLFEDNEKEENQGHIRVLTVHKSKGDEFDYVFIPYVHNKNFSLLKDEIKLKESARFSLSIQNSKKTDEKLKEEIIEENLRLLYVGITRAKKKLYITTSKEYKIFNKKSEFKPSLLFNLLGENL